MAGKFAEVVSNVTDTQWVIEHPYYPIGVQIAGYLANEASVPYLLGVFAAGCAVIFTATYLVTKKLRPTISGPELFTVMWFVLSGSIHLFFEG